MDNTREAHTEAAAHGILTQNTLIHQAGNLLDTMLDYQSLMLGYSCAMKQLRTKLEILNTEFEVQYQRNPISSIHTRLKSQPSVMEKMSRKGIPITAENIEANLNDIAGIRVVCCYVDDIYRIAEMLTAQADVDLIEQKDYIANPKPNGYRSLHLIVSVPVYFADSVKQVRAEVQIRTSAMDFWASLEHQIKYKKSVQNAEQILAQLKACADVISDTDLEMQRIRQKMDETRAEPSEAETVFEKLKRVGVPLGE